MRRVLFFLGIVGSFVLNYAQTVIENPEKPINRNAGRIVELQEIYQINDPGDKFYFLYPSSVIISPNNSLFLRDREQLLQFDTNGVFVRNYYKKGQGPGEMTSIGDFSFFPKGIIVQNIYPNKLIWFDFSGEFLKEFVIHGKTSLRYIFNYNESYYFIESIFPKIEGEPKIVDSMENLVEIQENGSTNKLADLSTKKYVVRGKSGGMGAIPLNNLIAASCKDRYLYISHTQEYQIKVFDANTNQIIKIIKREYPRVKQTKEDLAKPGGPIIDGEQIFPPAQKYANDIENLYVVGENLWVQTSIKDNGSQTLFDVFDLNGTYIDNFYIQLPERLGPHGHNVKPIDIYNGFLIAVEKNTDESLSVVKYRIKGNGISTQISHK